MTVNEIINGKVRSLPSPLKSRRGELELTFPLLFLPQDAFPGLLGVVNAYLNSLDIDIGAKCQIRKYLDLVKNRANGQFCRFSRSPLSPFASSSISLFSSTGTLMTPAAYYRSFIRAHPSYKFDSVVGAEICYDLAREVDDL